jgi:hypothetical protein
MEYFRLPATLRVRGKCDPKPPFSPISKPIQWGHFSESRYQVLPISRRLSEEAFHEKAKNFYSFGGTGACGGGGTPKAPPLCPYLVGEADEKIKVSPFSVGFRGDCGSKESEEIR